MKETGIIMSGSHPVDILEYRKTMTRRLWGLKEFNNSPNAWFLAVYFQDGIARFYHEDGREVNIRCPYGGYGDRLWVKEAWCIDSRANLHYKATEPDWVTSTRKTTIMIKWKPSIHMFRKDSRILLEITEIRAERLQEITPDDAVSEGCGALHNDPMKSAIENFVILWDSLNAKRGYGSKSNPWVWVISFKRLEKQKCKQDFEIVSY